MFISDTKRLLVKTAAAYFFVSIFCLAVTNIYAVFGHGIRSAEMDFMFLYPLIGGTAVFLPAAFIMPKLPEKTRRVSRAGYNLYNSGIASLTCAAMLTGITEIAGTASKWILYIKTAGIIFIIAAAACQTAVFFCGNADNL